MKMESTDFPSREDKIIWVVALVLLNALGALLFWITFKEREALIPQIELWVYHNLKQKYEEYTDEINMAIQMAHHKRYEFEKYYQSMSHDDLVDKLKKGPEAIGKKTFGVLLAVLSQQGIDIKNL